MKTKGICNLVTAFTLFTAIGAKAEILVTDTIATSAQSPGVFRSGLDNVSLENFTSANGTSLAAGEYKNLVWNGVGTIDNVSLINNNSYGGVPGASTYAVQSATVGNGVKTTTIALNTPSSYFGMYWSAGDANNTLSFYNGNNLVGNFSTKSLMDKLPAGFFGNPNPGNLGTDKTEPFGFVNFTSLNGDNWNKIVLTDTTSSGFESQNWSSRVDGWNPVVDGALPGTPVALVTMVDGVSSSSIISGITTSGNTVNVTTGSGSSAKVSSFLAAAPGAPAPPLTACLAFVGVLLLQAFRGRKETI